MPQETYPKRNKPASESNHLHRVREAAEALFRPKTSQPTFSGATAQRAVVVSKPSTRAGAASEPVAIVSGPGMPVGATPEPAGVAPEPSTRAARHLPVQQSRVATVQRQQYIATEIATTVKRKINRKSVPKSERGRIRVLVSYGMTIEQVATLYDVTIDTIEKVIL